MPKLILNPTASNRREIPLVRTTILTIGRDPSNDLVLPDAMVSRRHAVIETRGRQFFLRDCNSANGSVVNGDRVSERGLRDGDLVAIGSMRLLFRDEALEAVGGKVLPHPSAAPLECPACKAPYRRGDLFCRECGAQVAQQSGPPKAVCAACGAAVPLPARFCNACGETLAPDGQRLVEPPPEPKPHDTQPVPLDAGEAAAPRASGSMAIAAEPQAAPAATPFPEKEPKRERTARPREMIGHAEGARPREMTGHPEGARPREMISHPEGAPREKRAPAAARGGRPELEPADAGSRLAAFVVDTVFVVSGQAVLLAPVGWYWWAREAPRSAADVSLLPVVASVTLLPLALLLGVLYHVYFWSVKGATPGKELLDLRVTTDDGTSPIPLASALRRALGYLLSAASLGVGFLMVAFSGRGLHDRIAGTRVVKGAPR
jgi:uncharacterized RDD family membrane protein YckC